MTLFDWLEALLMPHWRRTDCERNTQHHCGDWNHILDDRKAEVAGSAPLCLSQVCDRALTDATRFYALEEALLVINRTVSKTN